MKRLNKIISKVLGIREESIGDDTSPDNVDTWDSFNALVMVSELENEFMVQFTMDEITSVKCVKDIKESLRKHGVKIEEEG